MTGRDGWVIGPEHGALTLLFWTRLSSADLREELLTQWLVSKEPLPSREIMVAHFEELLNARPPGEIEARIRELDVILNRLEFEKSCRGGEFTVLLRGTKDETINALVDDSEPFGTSIFVRSKEKRRTVYRKMPPPRRMSEIGNPTATYVYSLLWLFEPDEGIRRGDLQRHLEVACNVFHAGGLLEWAERMEPIVETLAQEQQESRKQFISKMKSRA